MKFEGALSTKAILLAKKRVVDVIYIDEEKKDRNTDFILQQAQKQGVVIKRVPRHEIDELCDGKTHGGIVSFAQERKYQSLDSILKQKGEHFICVLEGIEDPFNLGYALRTLYSAGCQGVILRERDWSFAEGAIVKSSAGASEYLAWVSSSDIAKDIQKCKAKGCKAIAAMRQNAVDYYDVDYTGSFVLAIGGEMRGLSRSVLSGIEQNIVIPYANDFKNALNASSAVAALSFEVVRQRRKGVK
ncbi:MAG: TrmH family RNA methyltransferase [Anaerorhabdus sp.]